MVSAKTGENVFKIFQDLKYEELKRPDALGAQDMQEAPAEKKGCC